MIRHAMIFLLIVNIMAEILVQKTIGGLKPINDSGENVFSKWKLGDIINVRVTKPRNGKLHAKFFALLEKTLDNQAVYSTLDELREAVTIDAGYYETFVRMDDVVQRKAKSIQWSQMDDIEFSDLYSAVVDSCLKLLPGTASEDLEREIAAF